jgi:hypothetical protein
MLHMFRHFYYILHVIHWERVWRVGRQLILSAAYYYYYCSEGSDGIYMSFSKMGTLLKKQSSITVYSLPTTENKLPLSVSVCSKQKRKFARFCFPFAVTNRCCHFQLVRFFACSKHILTAAYYIFLLPFQYKYIYFLHVYRVGR